MTCHLQLCDKYYLKLCIFSDYTDSSSMYSHCGRQQCSICVLYFIHEFEYLIYKYCIYSNLHLFIYFHFVFFKFKLMR